jgi:hypothetical protein
VNHLLNHLTSLTVTESPPESRCDTVEIVTVVAEDGQRPEGVEEKTWHKLINVWRAMRYAGLVPPDSMAQEPTMSSELCKQLHALIGDGGLIDDAGEFRTKNAGAAHTSVVYCMPDQLAVRLKTLLAFINEFNKQQCS